MSNVESAFKIETKTYNFNTPTFCLNFYIKIALLYFNITLKCSQRKYQKLIALIPKMNLLKSLSKLKKSTFKIYVNQKSQTKSNHVFGPVIEFPVVFAKIESELLVLLW